MKFTITVNPEESPNQVGEILRAAFFDQSDGKFGCYSTFDYNKHVLPIPHEIDAYDHQTMWHCAERKLQDITIKMRYFWDGDGTLEFQLPDGYLINNDCKKDYCWEWRRYEY